MRNPLHVVISLSYRRGKSADDTIDFMVSEGIRDKQVHEILGSRSEHVHRWTRVQHPAIYVMRYEDTGRFASLIDCSAMTCLVVGRTTARCDFVPQADSQPLMLWTALLRLALQSRLELEQRYDEQR